jgi:hypothetical protein
MADRLVVFRFLRSKMEILLGRRMLFSRRWRILIFRLRRVNFWLFLDGLEPERLVRVYLVGC